MTIAQIECFLETVRLGSITKAAESLFITQQGVSKQLQSIEKELGFSVLDRNRKGVELTEEGKILFDDWLRLYDIYRISVDKAHDFHIGKEKNVHIGLEDMGNCSEDIMLALREYEKKYSDLTIISQIMTPREMYYKLESAELDFAICYESELKNVSSFKCFPLHEKNLDICVFLAKDHPLSADEITMKDLQNVPIGILSSEISRDFKDKMQDFFAYYGLPFLNEVQEYSSRRNLEIGLIAGRCATIVYETMFKDEGHKLFSKKLDIDIRKMSSRIAVFWKLDENTTKARSLALIAREKFKKYD